MVYSLAYRRPSRVTICSQDSSLYENEKSGITSSRPVSVDSGKDNVGVPAALSFDRIIAGGTCPPCTTRDFMDFLIYIERAAENLQFFLWFKDYSHRFTALPASEQALAPAWSRDRTDVDIGTTVGLQGTKAHVSAETAAVFKGTDFSTPVTSVTEVKSNPFGTPPLTPMTESESMLMSEKTWTDAASTAQDSSKVGAPHRQVAAAAFDGAEVKWQPFTIQPFRDEIARIIAIYIADGSPRQLNLSAKERGQVLHALASTTHPSAFKKIVHTVEWSLRHQAHPNFIRWTICNGNRPRVIFARGLGVALIMLGTLVAVILTLSHLGRGWRILSALLFLFGISTLIAAWKGMCVVLHGMHHRHLRPWELFATGDTQSSCSYDMHKASFDSCDSSNSYEDQPWVAQYERRNVIRKVFDREVWIKEPALRQIQDTIFLQALLGALVLTCVIVAVFCAIPKGNHF